MVALVIFVLGLVVCLVSSIWSLVVAARQSVWWLLACLFLPFAALVFLVKHWAEAKSPFLLSLGGVAAFMLSGFLAARDPAGAQVLTTWMAARGGASLPFTIPTAGGWPGSAAGERGGATGDLRTASNGSPGPLNAQLQGLGLVRFQDGRWQPMPAEALRSKRLFAFYYSAHWCPPCRAFTPKLVSFYREFTATHPEFELVFVSADYSEEEMRGYAQETGMPWLAVPYDKVRAAGLPRSSGRGIPSLLLVDGNGRVLSDSFAGSAYLGPQKVLDDLAKFPAGGSVDDRALLIAAPNSPPRAKGEIPDAARRGPAATDSAGRQATQIAEKQAAYAKGRAEAEALYTSLNARRAKLKVDDAKTVAAFNADAARYAALLEQTRAEKLALDELTFGAGQTPAPALAETESSKPEVRGAKQVRSSKPETKTTKL